MQTPTRIRTVARILAGSMLTTVALGLVATPGMAEEVAPATPGPHTIPDSPVLPEDLVLPEPGDDVPSVPDLLGELPEGAPMPEGPEITCEEWREIFEVYPLPPGTEVPECPVEEDRTDGEDGDPTFPIDEIPLPEDLDEIPLPFDPGEIPLPLDPDEGDEPEGAETSEPEDPETSDPDDESEGGTPDDDTDGEEDTGGSDDGDEGPDDADSGSGTDDTSDDPEVAGTSTEAPTDDVTAAGDDTPTPTRVDAGAGGSVLTIARRTLVLVAAAVLALGLLTAGGIMLARSTDR